MNGVLLGDVSMITPIGIGLDMVYSSVKAGINRYTECDLIGTDDDPVRMALVPNEALTSAHDNHSGLEGILNAHQERLLCLAIAALNTLAPRLPDVTLPLF